MLESQLSLNTTCQLLVGIQLAVCASPLQHGVMDINRTSSFSPAKVIPDSVNNQRAVELLVLQERNALFQLIEGFCKQDQVCFYGIETMCSVECIK